MRGFEKSQIILSIFREGGDADLRVRSGIEGAGMVLEILKNERRWMESMEEIEEAERYEDYAVVLIAHGSKLPYNKEVLKELREMMERRGLFKTVRMAFMQLNKPSIDEVIRELASEGMKNIVALPVFLANGAHTTEDIPNILRAVRKELAESGRNDVRIIYGEPIGADERIVDILIDRIKDAIG